MIAAASSQLHARMNLIVMLEAASLFYIFKNKVRIGFVGPVNKLARAALGIYVVHECWLFNLYQDGESLHGAGGLVFEHFFHCGASFFSSVFFPVYYLAVVLVVFALCAVVECVRIMVFDEWLFSRAKRLDALCKGFDAWYKIG